MNNIVAVIQARMTSSRLPNKVLLPLSGKPVLAHIVERIKQCKTLNKIIVATSNQECDNPIENWCRENEVLFFRGELLDVLDRYYQAATKFEATAIVRITADCPVIDPGIVDEVVTEYLADDFDYYSLSGEFPDGLDCQVFSYKTLKRAWMEAKLPSEREHVGPYMENNLHLFKVGNLNKFRDLSIHRWTLDEPEDYEFLKIVFNRLYHQERIFDHKDILELMKVEPTLMKINAHIPRNQGYLNSLKNDTL